MTIFRIGALALTLAALAAAQDKVTVPLTNPSQPVTVKMSQVNGSITVVAGKPGEIVVETGASRNASRKAPEPPPGMHRIGGGRDGIEVAQEGNVVTVQTGRWGMGGNTTLQVPENSSLHLTSVNGGPLDVTGISGEVEADIVNGSIRLKGVSGAVVAHSVNGAITVAMDKVAADKAMSFTTLNGKIDVTLPADTKARLRLKSERGTIYSDFDVKLEAEGKATLDDGKAAEAKYRIRVDRSVTGTINGGGPEYRFESMNGNIVIHKK